MIVHFDRLSWGLLVSKPPKSVADLWKEVVVDPAHQGRHAVTFCRIRFVKTSAPSPDPLLLVAQDILWDDAAKSSVKAILESKTDGRVAFMSEESVGLATVEDLPSFPREFLAAAAGVARASGNWDESRPIVAHVSDESFDVYPSFEDGAWRAKVSESRQ